MEECGGKDLFEWLRERKGREGKRGGVKREREEGKGRGRGKKGEERRS